MMTEEWEGQLNLFASLPALTEDELEDAEFRAKDRAWAALVEVFEDRKAESGLNYQMLGDRIHRSRKQIQRWLSSSVNMTLGSIGLLAEGMDADLQILVLKRELEHSQRNHVHPSDAARAWVSAWNSTLHVKAPTANVSGATQKSDGFEVITAQGQGAAVLVRIGT